MHPHIKRLYQLAEQDSRRIIGLMSGTSVDGLDIALCRISGSGQLTRLALEAFETIPYEDAFRDAIHSVFARRDADLEQVCLLHGWIAGVHARMIQQALQQWGLRPEEIDLVASHGQTIYHAPARQHERKAYSNATLQIGDGDHLAVGTGIITLSDFRQKHVAAGGEGAPLAVYGDYFLFTDTTENRILLNMGGIANFTFLPAGGQFSDVFCSDTGPGNTMMDAWTRLHFPGSQYDVDSAIALRGRLIPELLEALLDHPFFGLDFPKTTGPEVFNIGYLQTALAASGTEHRDPEDIMTTLNEFSAESIANALRAAIKADQAYTIYASGGGVHNPLLMSNISRKMSPIEIRPTSDLGIHPDAKEAVLFAVLANETVAGKGLRSSVQRRGIPEITMGKISFPD